MNQSKNKTRAGNKTKGIKAEDKRKRGMEEKMR